MNRYKIRVKDEVESKESQELFFELGYVWQNGKREYLNYGIGVFYILARKNKEMTYCDASEVDFNSKNNSFSFFRTITLPELRHLVVLKRNDVGDATHIRERDQKPYFQSFDKKFYYHMQDDEWVLSTWMNEQLIPQLKPIGKTMKEYLNEKYELITAPESEAKEPHAKGWLEVPEGAEILTVGIDQRVFWKGDLSWNLDGYETKEWRSTDSFPIYMKNYEKTVKVLWQRNKESNKEDQPTNELIMNANNDEGKLISGKEALIALANGEDVEWNCKGFSGENWHSVLSSPHTKIGAVEILNHEYGNDAVGYYGDVLFRLKSRTISINGIEVPAPDDITDNPKGFEVYWEINIGNKYYLFDSEQKYNKVAKVICEVLEGDICPK